MTYTLGVDLGTTFTAAAVDSGSGPVPLKLGTGTEAMPSVVAIRNGEPVTGEAAEEILRTTPAAGVREAKRRLGDATPFIIDGTPYGAEALMGLLLADVISRATEEQGEAPASVVLAHPANWGDFKKDLLSDTARVAGLEDVGLITEPQAAAIHYVRSGELAVGQTAAVYDFGGGTFDAAVVRCAAEGPELLGDAKGLERLGGIDLDQAILVHVNDSVGGALRDLDASDPAAAAAMASIRSQCVAAKETLSTASEATVSVALPGLNTEIRITRTEFEEMLRPRIADTLAQLDAALNSAGITAKDLNAVVLVGGSSRIPLVGEMVAAHTGVRVVASADHKTVVCLGTAAGDAPAAVPTAASEAEAADAAPAFVVTGPRGSGEPGAAGSYGGGVTKRRLAIIGGAAVLAGGAVVAGASAAGATPADAMNALGFGDDDAHNKGPGLLGAKMDVSQLDEFGEKDHKPLSGPDGPGPGGGHAAGAVGHALGGSPMARAAAVSHRHAAPAAAHHPGGADADGHSSMSGPGMPGGSTHIDPAFAQAKNEMLASLQHWQPPAGVDPKDADAFRTELLDRIERFQPMPGESTEHALASMKDVYQDQVKDFVQDQRIHDIQDPQAPPGSQPPTDAAAEAAKAEAAAKVHQAMTDYVTHVDLSEVRHFSGGDVFKEELEFRRYSASVTDGPTKIEYGPVQPQMAVTQVMPEDKVTFDGTHIVTFINEQGRTVRITTTDTPEVAMAKYAAHLAAQPPFVDNDPTEDAPWKPEEPPPAPTPAPDGSLPDGMPPTGTPAPDAPKPGDPGTGVVSPVDPRVTTPNLTTADDKHEGATKSAMVAKHDDNLVGDSDDREDVKQLAESDRRLALVPPAGDHDDRPGHDHDAFVAKSHDPFADHDEHAQVHDEPSTHEDDPFASRPDDAFATGDDSDHDFDAGSHDDHGHD
jgi:actin-like ATPase involved in cell morphogenesis